MSEPTQDGAPEREHTPKPSCMDCGIHYDSPHWIEAVVSHEAWATISGRPDGGGLLCHRCMDERAAILGLKLEAKLFWNGRGLFSASETERVERLRVGDLVAAWQPIETAPRDGSCVLGHSDQGTDRWSWDDQRFHTRPKPYWSRAFYPTSYDRAHQPTHWITLPEPPAAIEKAGRR